MDDLATWLRALLDHHADVHRRLVLAEGQNPDHEREADPDGFWALWESQSRMLEFLLGLGDEAERGLKLLALAHQYADGYRPEWHPDYQEGEE